MFDKKMLMVGLFICSGSLKADNDIASGTEKVMNSTSHVLVNNTTVTAAGSLATIAFVPVSILTLLHLKYATKDNNITGLDAHKVFYLKALCALYAVMQSGLFLTMSSHKKRLFYIKMNILAYCAGLTGLVYGLGFADAKAVSKVPMFGSLYANLYDPIRKAMDAKHTLRLIEEQIEVTGNNVAAFIAHAWKKTTRKCDRVARALRLK